MLYRSQVSCFPEAADPTKARGDFSRRFSAEAVMTSNVACHAVLWTENSNEHLKTRDQQKHDIEIPQNGLV